MKTHQKFCVTFKSNKRIKYMYSNRFATFKFGKTNNALLILKINLSARLRLCGRRRQKIERKLPKEIKKRESGYPRERRTSDFQTIETK